MEVPTKKSDDVVNGMDVELGKIWMDTESIQSLPNSDEGTEPMISDGWDIRWLREQYRMFGDKGD